MQFTGERFVPGEVAGQIETEHLSRYSAVAGIVEGKDVLDLACGEGYGSYHMAQAAAHVLGVDIDEACIGFAGQKYKKENLQYCVGSASHIPAEDASFDVVVSFETIEHIGEKDQQAFLPEIRRVLRPDGILVMSTPDKKLYSDEKDYHNEYHVKEFYEDDFLSFLRQAFAQVCILRQGIWRMGKQEYGVISDTVTAPLLANVAFDAARLPYMIAVCANHDINGLARRMCQVYVAAPDTRVSTDFFFDRGQGFHHGDKLMKSVSPKDGIYQVQWEWDDSDKPAIRRLRFDWVDTASSFRLLDVKTNIRGLTIAYPNAKLEQGIYYFYDMDPGIILTGDIPSVGYATITYKMQPLTVTDLVRHSAGQEAALGERERQVQNIQEIAADKEKTIRAQEALTQELRGGITDRDRKIAGIEIVLAERDESLRAQEALAQELRGEIADRDHKIAGMETALAERDQRISDVETALAERDESLRAQEALDQKLRGEIMDRDRKIAGMETALAERDESLRAQEALDQELRGEITDRDRKIAGMETALAERDQRISGVENELAGWGERLREQESAVLQLRADVEDRDRQLNDIRSSHAWALMLRLWKVRDLIIPMNSRRRLFAKMAYKTMTSPRVMFSKLTMENIHKLFRYLRTESPADVEARLALHVPSGAPPSEKLVLLPENHEDTGSQETSDPLSGYEAIVFPTFDDVDVSIIIPVYNQFGYTYNCLRSIHEHTRDIRYEVIVADDTSTDVTKDMERIVENAVILHNTENLGFLRNCNHAATKARGKYIFFLNNDTQVQPDWLPPLAKLLDEQPDIGMTGSKLVYPDGHLQEAGGIFWNDGSAWNYGHGGNPDAPEYNYVKDVDYISGAAILIRRTLWEKIGGFDERFIPAYCEDADLAFTVRREGYRVVYQPLSVVVHFEGVSNGRDLTQGIKQYQVENQKKFYEKWKDVLEKEHFPNGQDVFWARDRSRNKKTIVVVDHYVPHFDQDAGSRTAYQYMQMFVELGMKVIFVGDNFFPHQPYTTALEQLGVEVLAGTGWSRDKLEEWITTYARYIDVFHLSRPHISIHYIDMIRERTNAQILYYDVDLHFLREQREYEKEHDPAILESSIKWKKIESEIVSKADVVYTAGTYEALILSQMFPGKKIHSIPIYLYDSINYPHHVNHNNGNPSLLFVGGFVHKPNLDAMLWFLNDIFPLILEKNPNVILYIIGSNSPKILESFVNENVILLGFVSDEQLEAYYQKAGVSVVPLRFGAGVKGKVIEALYMGTPVVTTMVGAEGIPDADQAMLIADDAETFANNTLRLLEDNVLRERQIDHGRELIRKHFTKRTARAFLREDIKCLQDVEE